MHVPPSRPHDADSALLSAWMSSVEHGQALADQDAALDVASVLTRAAGRTRATARVRIETLGRVPLAADRRTRFPLVWVVPSLEIGRRIGSDVTAWLIGHEDRTFLRLVNVDPEDRTGAPLLRRAEGGLVRPEVRVRPELPFALDELAADRVYELLPSLDPGSRLVVNDGEAWSVPPVAYDAERERATSREGWNDLMTAYVDDSTANQGVRRTQLAGALARLLWFEAGGRPRRLRPWALLTLQSLAAEILRAAPRRARAFGLDALRGHPQCFPSLARRLEKE